MNIAPTILEHYSDINESQREVIGHIDGPLLAIAGPGSGKTYSIVLRALNILLLEKARPRDIILCTFTEKAAYEMRDRFSLASKKVGYQGDLSELRVSTIHSLCNHILTQHRHRTLLGHNYDTLDDLTQLLFIFDHFKEIFDVTSTDLYLYRWKTRWTAIDGARTYFDKITEELIDPNDLLRSSDMFISSLGNAYKKYSDLLINNNKVDFAHLQKLVYELLLDPAVYDSIVRDIKYVIVDEYQDTNFIQEQLLLRLTEMNHNLCVVGDEDQSLYRFRGATVRNILEFPARMPGCRVIKLTTNYRSHKNIIEKYDHWMATANWHNPKGTSFRFDKRIEADLESDHPEYPAVFCIWGNSKIDEAERFADFVKFLKENKVIEDYNQVALLLHSVRQEHSQSYLDALQRIGIPGFCPRARAYFENDEIRIMIACFAVIFGWFGEGRGNVAGAIADLATYVDSCLIQLGRSHPSPHPIALAIRADVEEINSLRDGESLDTRPADYFYQFLSLEPFFTMIKNENAARNLAIFSQLLNVFQNYYHYTVVTYQNREYLRLHLFNSFLRLLYDGGINEYEDPDQPFPQGYVQIMTIHQSKGLEFPVVVVGSLSKQLSSQKQTDRDLGPYYHRAPFEPENRITAFDRMRLHYVAFSRPQKILFLTSHETPKDYFRPIWQELLQWPYVQKDLLAAQQFHVHERMPLKRTYSFTGDLKIYETCPRQYQFFREYDFTPSRSAVIFFGLLVHQNIEEIHRYALDGKLDTLDESRIRQIFDRTYQFLCLSDVRPIGDRAKESAFLQIMNYFAQNKEEMRRVIQTEVDVSLEKDGYILVGKVDLLLGGDGCLELLDFKTSPKPADSPELLLAYERQLCTYAHILEQRHGHKVDRLLLYWTAEYRKEDALMTFPYRSEKIKDAAQYFDKVVKQIQDKKFKIIKAPESGICKECDLRRLCLSEGVLT